uniref:Uncharacterized protein n=1 Tax=Rhizobium leguminosarum TaxID=384 RepID=A0A154IFC9_RHILE|nr:hypothetical protein A4A59_25770 [Rhizobium leguminosarum]
MALLIVLRTTRRSGFAYQQDWGRTPTPSLIPVLVTGIQPRRVRAVNEPIQWKESFAPKDLGALDSCDKHRNEDERERLEWPSHPVESVLLPTLQRKKAGAPRGGRLSSQI